jgi:hypothetical protein
MRFLEYSAFHSAMSMLFLAMMVACSGDNPNKAGVKKFYYEFEDNINQPWTQELIGQLGERFQQGDYLISAASAEAGWPFYATVERGAMVLKSDMIPPHTKVNRLTPISQLDLDDDQDHPHKLLVILDLDSAQQLHVTKQSYTWENGDWEVFSKRLYSELDPSYKGGALVDTLSKTLIRYTFK